MSEASAQTTPEPLPEHARDWLESVAYAESDAGKARGARAYRMSYDGEVSSGVVDFTEHGGGHFLDSDKTGWLIREGYLSIHWPCDEGYVPDWFDPYEDDGDDWPCAFECNSYCGECEPRLALTDKGRAAIAAAASPAPEQEER